MREEDMSAAFKGHGSRRWSALICATCRYVCVFFLLGTIIYAGRHAHHPVQVPSNSLCMRTRVRTHSNYMYYITPCGIILLFFCLVGCVVWMRPEKSTMLYSNKNKTYMQFLTWWLCGVVHSSLSLHNVCAMQVRLLTDIRAKWQLGGIGFF